MFEVNQPSWRRSIGSIQCLQTVSLMCWFWGWFANSKKSLCYFPGLMKYTPLLTTCRLPNRRIYVEHFNHSSRGGCFTLTEIYETGSRPLYPMDPTTNERERLSKTMFIWYYHLMLDSTSRTLRCGGIPRTIVLKGLSLRGDFASIAIKFQIHTRNQIGVLQVISQPRECVAAACRSFLSPPQPCLECFAF